MNEPIEREGLLYDSDELRRYFELPSVEPDAVIAVCDTKNAGPDYCVMPIAYQYGPDFYIEQIICDNGTPDTVEPKLVDALLQQENKERKRQELDSSHYRHPLIHCPDRAQQKEQFDNGRRDKERLSFNNEQSVFNSAADNKAEKDNSNNRGDVFLENTCKKRRRCDQDLKNEPAVVLYIYPVTFFLAQDTLAKCDPAHSNSLCAQFGADIFYISSGDYPIWNLPRSLMVSPREMHPFPGAPPANIEMGIENGHLKSP